MIVPNLMYMNALYINFAYHSKNTKYRQKSNCIIVTHIVLVHVNSPESNAGWLCGQTAHAGSL